MYCVHVFTMQGKIRSCEINDWEMRIIFEKNQHNSFFDNKINRWTSCLLFSVKTADMFVKQARQETIPAVEVEKFVLYFHIFIWYSSLFSCCYLLNSDNGILNLKNFIPLNVDGLLRQITSHNICPYTKFLIIKVRTLLRRMSLYTSDTMCTFN